MGALHVRSCPLLMHVYCLLLQFYVIRHSFICIAELQVDGRQIGAGRRGPVCERLQGLYTAAMDAQARRGRIDMS